MKNTRNHKMKTLYYLRKMRNSNVQKSFLSLLLFTFFFTSPLVARCNKSGLEKLMSTRKILCTKGKHNQECTTSDQDIKSYLVSFANKNDVECDRLHQVYNAPDKAIIEKHHLNVKKK